MKPATSSLCRLLTVAMAMGATVASSGALFKLQEGSHATVADGVATVLAPTLPATPSSVEVELDTAVIEGRMFVAPPVGRIVYFLRIKPDLFYKPFKDPLVLIGVEQNGATDLLNQADSGQDQQQETDPSQPGVQGWFDISDKDADLQRIDTRDEDENDDETAQKNTPSMILLEEEDEEQLVYDLEMVDKMGLLDLLETDTSLFHRPEASLDVKTLRNNEALQGDAEAGQYFNFLVKSQFAALGIPVGSVSSSGNGNYLSIQFHDSKGEQDKTLSIKRSLYGTAFKSVGDSKKGKFKWPGMQVIFRWVFVVLTVLCLILVFFGGGTEAIVATLFFSSLTALTFINFSYFFAPS